MSVNGASPISGLASWIMTRLHASIKPQWQYWPPLLAKRPTTISLPPPKNVGQWCVNNFWSCIIDNSRAVQRHTPIIIFLAAFLSKNASNDIATPPKNERQWNINDLWTCILDYQTAMRRR
jgi:hypothetical protein